MKPFCVLVVTALVALQCLSSAAGVSMWPVPHDVTAWGPPRALDGGFVITSDNTNANLKDAMARYQTIITKAAASGTPVATSGPPITSLSVVVTGSDNSLNQKTDYGYLLEVSNANTIVTVQAKSVFGAIYGMETFSQLVSGGALAYTYAYISDNAQYEHRGLLVDSGRRFAPVPMLETLMDAMSYSKMNVLHLHLSDWGGFRLEVAGLSELYKNLDGQYYTLEDAEGLVDYATKRGIRIVAEVDVPAHSGCFAPLSVQGLEFCDSTNELLKYTPTNMYIIQQAIQGVMDVFPDYVVHLGGDETVPQGGCTWEDIHNFEKDLQTFVTKSNRQPMVWNEVFSKPNVTTEPNAAEAGTIIQNWDKSSSGVTASKSFATVVSQYDVLYLDQDCCATGNSAIMTGDKVHQCYYVDISKGVAPSGRPLIFGGEVAMWTDLYCPDTHCPNQGQYSWMFPPTADAAFTESLTAMIWPRAAGAAGAFWNFNASMVTTSSSYAAAIEDHNDRLIARGVASCPNGCTCDWGHKCGKAYGAVPALPMVVELTNDCTFKVHVKEATPCASGSGNDLTTLMPGDSFNVTSDFIVEGGSPLKIGDPWGEWIGSGGWRDLKVKLSITFNPSIPGYLVYTQTYPTPP